MRFAAAKFRTTELFLSEEDTMKTFAIMIAAVLITLGFTGIVYSADFGEGRGPANFTLDFN